jgi:BNR/Asp-box repeat protein
MASTKNVRVYLGTRKGTFVAESDKSRRKWKVRGPYHPGNDIYHVAPDPRGRGHVYAGVNSEFWGPMLYRSTDHGKSWTEIAPPLLPLQKSRKPALGPDAVPQPIQRIWHIEPGPASEPDTLFVGVDPYSLYRSDDRGASWQPVNGINEHSSKAKWNPGNGGPCLHTIILDPSRSNRMYVGISAAGMFRSDDGGRSFRPANKGVRTDFLPEKTPEVGQCVHKVVLDPANPETSYRQDHNGIHVSHDGMESWTRVGKALDSDFGFAVAAAAHAPGQAYFVPLSGETRASWGGALEVYRWVDKTRKFAPLIRGRVAQGELGVQREGIAADALDLPGIYVGTTTGQLVLSPDDGRSWSVVPHMFPGIHSVSVDSTDFAK